MTPTRDSINRVQDPIQPEVKQEKNDKIYQYPQGILNQNNTLNQGSPGTLIKQTPFITTREAFESLPIKEINLFTGIPYYKEQTSSIYPTIVKTPVKNCCIDGENLIGKAIKEKLGSITCHVFYVETDSEIELAIRKTAIRMTSEKGKPYYAELVRNCKNLKGFLLETNENLVMHSHGGKRKGLNCDSDNNEENIRSLMATRLGKSPSTINKYINYGRSLNNNILETLVQSKEGKKFFEAAASNKRRLIKNLKCDGKDESAVTEKISEKMGGWLEEFHEKEGKIKPIDLEPGKKNCFFDPLKPHKHHEEYEDNQEVETLESIHKEIQEIVEGLCAFVKEDNEKNEDFVVTIKGELIEITRRLSKHDALMEGN
jgi:hypothetical protein